MYSLHRRYAGWVVYGAYTCFAGSASCVGMADSRICGDGRVKSIMRDRNFFAVPSTKRASLSGTVSGRGCCRFTGPHVGSGLAGWSMGLAFPTFKNSRMFGGPHEWRGICLCGEKSRRAPFCKPPRSDGTGVHSLTGEVVRLW
jgi:hypothetical protein